MQAEWALGHKAKGKNVALEERPCGHVNRIEEDSGSNILSPLPVLVGVTDKTLTPTPPLDPLLPPPLLLHTS